VSQSAANEASTTGLEASLQAKLVAAAEQRAVLLARIVLLEKERRGLLPGAIAMPSLVAHVVMENIGKGLRLPYRERLAHAVQP
jgi:hypothetical protein